MSTRKATMPSHQKRIELAQNFIETIIPLTALSSGYIDIETAGFISGYTRKGATRALTRLTRQGYMHEHKVPNMTGQLINIYGLTREGWDYAEVDRANWTKQRYRANTRNHEMTILKLAHINNAERFERATNIGGKRLKSGGFSGGRYPDLMDVQGNAIEIELTMKSSRRYVGILRNYHATKTESIWYTPEKLVHRLSRIFGEICESKKYLKPTIFSFNEIFGIDAVNYSSARSRVKTYSSLDQIQDIQELSTLIKLYQIETNIDNYSYRPDSSCKSTKGMVFELPTGNTIVAQLKDEQSRVITNLSWRGKSPSQLFSS